MPNNKKSVKKIKAPKSKVVKTRAKREKGKFLSFIKKGFSFLKTLFFKGVKILKSIILTTFSVLKDLFFQTKNFIKEIFNTIYTPLKPMLLFIWNLPPVKFLASIFSRIFILIKQSKTLKRIISKVVFVSKLIYQKALAIILLKGFSKKIKKIIYISIAAVSVIVAIILSQIKFPERFYISSSFNSRSIDFSLSKRAIDVKYEYKNINDLAKLKNNKDLELDFHANKYSITASLKDSQNLIPGKEYNVVFDRKLFSKEYRPNSLTVSFKARPFRVESKSLKIYQDPIKKKSFKAVGEISFSHKVSQKELQKNVSLKEGSKNISLDFNLSDDRKIAYFSSQNIDIRDSSYDLKLDIDDDLRTTNGNAELASSASEKIKVPSASNFFKVSYLNSKIIKDKEKNDKPEQFLNIEFTSGVKASDLNQNLKVYLLPTTYTYETAEGKKKTKDVSYWSLNEINNSVLEQSKQMDKNFMPTPSEYSNIHSMKYTVKNSMDNFYKDRYLYVELSNNLKSKDGFKYKEPYKSVISVPGFSKELRVAASGVFLPFSGDGQIPILSRGISKIEVEIFKIKPSAFQHLITQTEYYSEIESPSFKNRYDFNEENISDKYSYSISVPNADVKEETYTSISPKKYINGDSGIFFIKLKDKDGYIEEDRFIVVSDIGLLTKHNNDGSFDIFAMSNKTGQPFSDVKISFLKKNGKVEYSQYTNVVGLTSYPKIKKSEYVAILAEKGADKMFLPLSRWSISNSNNYSNYDIGGEYDSSSTANSFKAFTFTDRGVYRPGETVNLAMMLKRENFTKINDISRLPFIIEVKDPAYKTIFEKKFSVEDENGFKDFNIPTKYTSKTGLWTAYLYIDKINGDNNFRYKRNISTTTFKVEEFKPDTMKLTTKIFQKGSDDKTNGWLISKDIQAEVKLMNLFGTPAQDRLVEASISVRPADFYFKKYSGFSFKDPYKTDLSTPDISSENLPSTKTNDEGIAILPIDVSKYTKGTYMLSLNTKGFEKNEGSSVESQASVLVSPNTEIVGYQSDRDLSFLKENSNAQIEFIAINPNLEKIEKKDLFLKKIKYKDINTLIKNKQGLYIYDNIKKEEVISKEKITISKNGSKINLKTDEVGQYTFILEDNDDVVWAKVDYEVLGKTKSQTLKTKDTNLIIKTDKSSYKNGQTATLSINSPYKGSGLITIEKDKVYGFKWFKMSGTTTTQTIEIPFDVKGNAYINVSLVRDNDSKEIFLNPHSYAVSPIKIDSSVHKIKMDLNTAEKLYPGQEFEVEYSADKSGKVIIFGVDEGILQLTKYKTPNPYSFYFNKKALMVSTNQTFDFIIPEYRLFKEISSTGAGIGDLEKSEMDMENAIARNLNPFKRKVKDSAVFWSGIKDVSPEKRTVKFQVPSSFNGQVRLMAVAVNDMAVGHYNKNLSIKSPLVLTGNAPFAMGSNDKFDLALSVSNLYELDKTKQDVTLNISTDDKLKLIGSSIRKVNVKYGAEALENLQFTSTGKIGQSNIKIQASIGDDSHKVIFTQSISIRPTTPFKTTIYSDFTTDNKVTLDLPKRDLRKELSTQTVSASYSPAIVLQSLNLFLNGYTHRCSEQLLSKFIGYMYSLDSNDESALTKDELLKKYESLVSTLKQRFILRNGLSLWDESSNASDFASAYAYHFFTIVREKEDLPLDKKFFDNIEAWAKEFVKSDIENLYDAELKAYTLYLLIRNGNLITNDLINFQTSFNKLKEENKSARYSIANLFIASINSVVKNTKVAEELFENYHDNKGKFKKEKYEYQNFFNSKSVQKALEIYLMTLHFKDKFELSNDDLETLLKPMQTSSYSTIYSSYVILSLSNVYEQNNNDSNNILDVELYNDKKDVVKSASTNSFKENITNDIVKVRVKKKQSNDLPMFITSQIAGFNKSIKKEERNEEIKVHKYFTDLEGKEITSAKIGEEFYIVVNAKSRQDYIGNVAIIDLLPGGLFIKDVLDSSEFQYVEKREDRVVAYTDLNKDVKVLKYKVQATTKGEFEIPPAYAENMYDDSSYALEPQKTLTIK